MKTDKTPELTETQSRRYLYKTWFYLAENIKLCNDWAGSFERFNDYIKETIGSREFKIQGLAKIDESLPYEPGNVRWRLKQHNSIIDGEEKRWCPNCDMYNELSDFAEGSKCKRCDRERRKDGRYKEKQKEWQQKNRLKRNHQQRLRTYNLSQQEFDDLFEKANHCCQICSSKDDLCIDHCHKGGHVRGVLCRNCNLGIGHIKDNPDLCDALIDYLDQDNDFRYMGDDFVPVSVKNDYRLPPQDKTKKYTKGPEPQNLPTKTYPKRNNYTNRRFGALTVIRCVVYEGNSERWECLCDCGSYTYVKGTRLNAKESISSCSCRSDTNGKITPEFVDCGPQYRWWHTMNKLNDLCPEWTNNYPQFQSDLSIIGEPNNEHGFLSKKDEDQKHCIRNTHWKYVLHRKDGNKWCTKCHTYTPDDKKHWRSETSCMECRRRYHREERPPKESSDKTHCLPQSSRVNIDNHFKGKCACCGKKGNHIDHCHRTNKIRGLLCNSCNVSLGHFEDDKSKIKSAKVYLDSV